MQPTTPVVLKVSPSKRIGRACVNSIELLESRQFLSGATSVAATGFAAPAPLISSEAQFVGHSTSQSRAVAPAVTTQPVKFKVLSVSGINRFQDNVSAIAVGGHYSVSFTVGVGTVKKIGDIIQQTTPAVGGDCWMIVAKANPQPGATAGQITVSRVDTWWNNKPDIKGLNYTLPAKMNLTLFKRVKLGDLIRWVPGATKGAKSYWKLNNELTPVEELHVSNLSSLPNLLNGSVTEIGSDSDQYNCYGYSMDPNDPTSVGWVADNATAPSDATKIQAVTDKGLVALYQKYGWHVIATGSTMPTGVSGSMVALYLNNGQFTHAALVTNGGVFAKMGRLGLFRFSSVTQMTGGSYGQIGVWLAK